MPRSKSNNLYRGGQFQGFLSTSVPGLSGEKNGKQSYKLSRTPYIRARTKDTLSPQQTDKHKSYINIYM